MPRPAPKFLNIKALMALCAAALAVAATHAAVNPTFYGAARGQRDVGATPRAGETPGRDEYVRRAGLWPQLRPALSALGDRLERPGRERLTLTGTLARGDAAPAPFVLVREFPDRLRLEVRGEGGPRVLVFGGGKSGGHVERSREEWEDVETLLFDTAEGFFSAQMRGAATRQVGQRVRLDDGRAADYAGPYCAVYQVTEEPRGRSPRSPRSKFYYFNADTLLLERVMSETVDEGGARHPVETHLSDWRKSEGQATPRRIVRVVDGKRVLTLTVEDARVEARADDGSFTARQ